MNGVEPMDKVPDKKIFFVIGVFFGILMLLSIAFFVLSNLSSTKNPSGGGLFTDRQQGDSDTSKNPTPQVTPTASYPPPPILKTSKWTFELRTKPTNIVAAQTYAFKQNYTGQEIRIFAEKLFHPASIKTTKTQVLAYTINNTTSDTEALRFNPQSGAFSFISTKGIPLLSQSGQRVTNDTIYDFLRSIDLYDQSIVVTAQYKDESQPGKTYFELHRDWRRMGLPVLNFVGMLNLPENQNLATLTMNSTSNAIKDGTIVSSTDGRSGYERLSDFNTITVVTDTNNRVVAIESSMRQIDLGKSRTQNLLTYEQAEAKLRNYEYDMIFNTPSGTGELTWDKIYPNNIATATETVITDAIYTYLEQSPLVSQTSLKPYILFKGYSTLTNGYRSELVAAVAVDQSVLGASTLAQNRVPEEDSAPKQIDIEKGKGSSMIDTTLPIPTIAPECDDPHFHIGEIDKAITYMGITFIHAKSYTYEEWLTDHWGPPNYVDKNGMGDWFYIPPANFNQDVLRADLKKISDNLNAFSRALNITPKRDFGFRDIGDWHRIWKDVNHTWGDDRVTYNWNHRCPIRLTGYTPTLFVYGKSGQTLQIHPSNTIYVDPVLNYDRWIVTIKDEYDLIVNNVARPYLYYDYSSVNFSRPRFGWIIDRNQLATFSSKVAAQLGLNVTEKDRLEVELTQGASMISENKIFIGLIDSQELNKKLPLKISPQPEKVYRYHFYLSSDLSKVSAPKINPIQRSEFMIVELGSYAAQ